MKRFRFRLESIRNLRAMREREVRQALAAALNRLNEAEASLAAVHARDAALATALREARTERFNPSVHIAGARAMERLAVEVAEAQKIRHDAMLARHTAHQEWLAARRDLQVLERLEERDRLLHHAEMLRVEQAEIDEFAGLTAARNPLATS